MMQQLRKLDARIPSWNMAGLVVRDCPVCSRAGGSVRFVRPDGLEVKHCDCCGVWYVSPAPSAEALSRFYASYSQTHQRLPDWSESDMAAGILEMNPEHSFVLQEIMSLGDVVGKKCLEVGFGRGHYLAMFRAAGGIPSGVELDSDAVRFVRDRLGIEDVRIGTIFELEAVARYDCVFLMDLVEHPLNVREMLGRVVELLKPNGLLVILTPNGSRIARESEPITLRVDLEHMQYFSCQTIRFLGERYGLLPLHIETFGFPGLVGIDRQPARGRQRWLGRMMRRIKSSVRRIPGAASLDHLRYSLAAKRMRMGDYHLFCILQKGAGGD